MLLGTPAEEGHTGKEYLIRAGALNGVDAAVMVHPFGYDIAEHAWVGRRTLDVTFSGVAAHASSQAARASQTPRTPTATTSRRRSLPT